MIRRLAPALTLFLVLLGCACSQEQPATAPGAAEGASGPVTELTEPRDALDEHLMVALGQAKNFHHKADVYLREARLEDAIAALRQIATIDFPDGAAEAVDVQLDARARLGTVLVAAGRTDEALEEVNAGLASAESPSFFLANLFTVRGEIHRQRADALAGDEAAEARRQAIADYDRAIQINERLLERLGGGTSE